MRALLFREMGRVAPDSTAHLRRPWRNPSDQRSSGSAAKAAVLRQATREWGHFVWFQSVFPVPVGHAESGRLEKRL